MVRIVAMMCVCVVGAWSCAAGSGSPTDAVAVDETFPSFHTDGYTPHPVTDSNLLPYVGPTITFRDDWP